MGAEMFILEFNPTCNTGIWIKIQKMSTEKTYIVYSIYKLLVISLFYVHIP